MFNLKQHIRWLLLFGFLAFVVIAFMIVPTVSTHAAAWGGK